MSFRAAGGGASLTGEGGGRAGESSWEQVGSTHTHTHTHYQVLALGHLPLDVSCFFHLPSPGRGTPGRGTPGVLLVWREK